MVSDWRRNEARIFAAMVLLSVGVALVALATGSYNAVNAAEADAKPAPAAASPRQVTIAAYNVENMFDVFDNPYTRDEGTDVKLHFQIKQVAEAVRKLDADVVGFSEIENEFLLKQMVETFLSDMGYRNVVVQKTNDQRGINLGVISRLPILKISSYRTRRLHLPDDPRQWFFARDLMHVALDVGEGEARPLHVLITHFKSKRDSEGDPKSASWRLAEASEARRIIADIVRRDRAARVALVGDLNDTDETPTIATLTRGGLLTSAHANLPQEERITYLREPYRSQIDYIFASPALYDGLKTAAVPAEEDLIDGSDHAPVVATFELPAR